jgi:anti-sigma factor RsiW
MPGATCKDSVSLLLEYIDGSLADDVRARLEAHFGDCSPCEDFLKSYRATPHICRKALEAKMPKSFSDKLTSFLREEMKKPV